MVKSEKSLRQQLLEARADIQRQIEILEVGPIINARGGGPRFEPVISELTTALKEIEDRLADIGDGRC